MTNIQQARAVVAQWATTIGAVAQIETTHTKPAGLEVKTFFVTTKQGRRFVLKNVLTSPAATRLDAEYQLLHYLRDCGIPVAVPVVSDDNRLFIQNEQGIYLLYPVLPTDEADAPPVARRVIYTNLGCALAKLHQALALYPHHIDSWTMKLSTTIADEAVPQIRNALTGEPLTRFEQAIATIQPDMHRAFATLPLQYIHGDCHAGNILFYHGEVSGFIDLDHLPQGPRVYDIGYLLADMAKARFFGYHGYDNWMEDFTFVLSGYEKIVRLTEQERHALWFVMVATQLMFAYWLFKHNSPEAAQKNLDSLYWLYEHKTEIQQRIELHKSVAT